MSPAEPQKPQFAKLPPGRNERSPEETAAHQRERLLAALVDSVARNGYPATTLREVVSLAGVSNTTFYAHFGSMQECFLAAFDEIVARVAERVGLAYMSTSGFPAGLRACLDAYADFVVEEPAQAHLVLVDLIGLGAEGVARRQQVAGAYELLVAQSFGEAPPSERLSELEIRGIVGGIQRIAYRRSLADEVDRLHEDFAQIHQWAVSYMELGRRRGGAALGVIEPDEGASVKRTLEEEWEDWRGAGPGGEPSRRERIVRAALTVAGERGYMSLSIPAITRAARVSNETFYEHFSTTQEAFLAAIDALGNRAVERVGEAFRAEASWPEGVRAGLRELLGFLAENPGLARLMFIDALVAGPGTLNRVDLVLDTLAEMFGLRSRPGADGTALPTTVMEAIVGGPFFIVQGEISEGRTRLLPRLADYLADFVLTPYGDQGRNF